MQRDHIGGDLKIPTEHRPETSVCQYIALPVLLSNQAHSPELLLFV
jgi:hypothetical protein